MDRGIFSTLGELEQIASIIKNYTLLPISSDAIPGRLLEGVLAYVRDAEVLPTYDFVDVIKRDRKCGWQIKSSKRGTPVTWARVKIADSARLISLSETSSSDLQTLGDEILRHCNRHIQYSLAKYKLSEVGYARLILNSDRTVTYFERLLVTKKNPVLFAPERFEWSWSVPNPSKTKELLPSLQGFDKETGEKWFSWYGRGENQLHFNGEKNWWLENDPHEFGFQLPRKEQQLDFEDFAKLLSGFS